MNKMDKMDSGDKATITLMFKGGQTYVLEVEVDEAAEFFHGILVGDKETLWEQRAGLPVAFVNGGEVVAACVGYPAEYVRERELSNMDEDCAE